MSDGIIGAISLLFAGIIIAILHRMGWGRNFTFDGAITG
jgi:hypothetical protein